MQCLTDSKYSTIIPLIISFLLLLLNSRYIILVDTSSSADISLYLVLAQTIFTQRYIWLYLKDCPWSTWAQCLEAEKCSACLFERHCLINS